ncbi:hypothetical protein [Thiomicrospira sp. WB1]|uniref:hypothetical protein n=1 Tax=Thiomicrospira sp. WB1 TaxID=1685380 RepID=UPI000749CDC3|nr:hypothetical protein [Thiomicrospira sp. WB1]KUJ71795.1 hypothetical protein AVO41_04850 [Thiomicrospira sp. WB1]
MHLKTRPHNFNDHVLIVLGKQGHPTFKTIHLDAGYLEKLGKYLVSDPHSQYRDYKVVASHNVFTQTNRDQPFDHALDEMIRNLILHKVEK